MKKTKEPEKKVVAYVFYPGYQTLDVVTDKSIFFFNLNDFTLFATMKDDLSQRIRDTKFELLISFIQSADSCFLHLVSEINADFKIGPQQTDVTDIYDLTIDSKDSNFSIDQFYQQVIHYLSILNIEAKHN